MITFESAPTSFTIENNVKILTTKFWTIGQEYEINLTKNSPTNYELKFEILNQEYDIQFNISFNNVITKDITNNDHVYPTKSINFSLKKIVSDAIGISQATARSINSVNTNLSEYGQAAVVVLPGLGTVIAQLNILKLVALLPMKYSERMLAFFKLFVSLDEEDILGKITTGLYSD